PARLIVLAVGHRVAELDGLLEPPHVLLVEFDVGRGDVLLEVRDRAGTGNRSASRPSGACSSSRRRLTRSMRSICNVRRLSSTPARSSAADCAGSQPPASSRRPPTLVTSFRCSG